MVRRWAGLVVAAAALGVVVPAHAATAATVTNPPQNINPSPNYWPVCVQQGTASQACTDAEVAAINGARSLEGVGPLTLPANFASLTPAQQTFVVSNLERVDRGLTPVAGMVDSLNTLATTAASNDADPYLSGWTVGPFQVSGWSSIWAGDLNPLAADYDWMYDDGWGLDGSYNLDCQSASASGCWGHRDAILRSGSHLITGVGTEQQSWFSVAQIFVAGSGTNPPFTYSWDDVTGGTAPSDTGPTDAVPTDPAPTVKVQPMVIAWTTTLSTGRAIGANIDPANGQRVRLRRHNATGWHTVRHTTATDRVEFDSVRAGRYRVVVDETASTARAVTTLRVA
jgi:hypothetical protein